MERNALIAVAISLVILVLYQEVILKRLYPQPAEQQEVAAGPTATSEPPPAPSAVAPPPLEGGEKAVEPVPATGGREIEIDTDLYHAVINTAGGRLIRFQLKHYRTTIDPSSPPQELVYSSGSQSTLGVELRGPESESDAGVLYTADRDRVDLSGTAEGTLVLSGTLGDATIRKTFVFRNDSYLFGVDVKASGATSFSEIGVSWDKQVEKEQHGVQRLFEQVAVLQGKKVLTEKFDKLADGKVLEKNIEWAGYDGHYFLAALVPTDGAQMRLWLKERDQVVEAMVLAPRTDGRLGAHLDVYVGPKKIETLEAAGHSLSRSVDLGYFTFVALPMLHALTLSHEFTGNYGIDIILLTVVIKVLFLPLTQRSFKSMKAMQKLQPQMAKIRERFKETPEQMNKEIMELYRRHKVNPLGGCLPMVLQIPVFIGLYNALLHAIELRHAPFMLWINDLSAPDRLGALVIPFVSPPGIPVLTLLMGVSMFLQQWMTPSTGDPTQQRVMMIMPLMFTFMFVNFPAGLSLYWLVNNILTIGQQFAINRAES